MIITCPHCTASFSVADEAYRPGRKARCSQCRHVFAMPALPGASAGPVGGSGPTPAGSLAFSGGGGAAPNDADFAMGPGPAGQAAPKKAKKSWLKYIVLGCVALACIAGLAFGGLLLKDAYTEKKAIDTVKARREAREQEAKDRKEQDAQVSSITLVNVRQTVVENKRIGPLVVIEGYARNDYDSPREFIEVEALLLDKAGKVLGRAKQAAGVSLMLTQLQVLSLDELGKALNNPVDILSKNVNILPGGQVPFLVVFSGVPEDLYSYEVRPIRAEIPPAQGQ